MCAVHHDAALMAVLNGVADERALWAVPHQVQVQAVLADETELATLFDPAVLHHHRPAVHAAEHHRVQPDSTVPKVGACA
jgi:hypothetical protein